MISARPPDSRSTVANCSQTRTGSSELSTVTELVSRMRLVFSAAAASRMAGAVRDEVAAVMLADAEHVEPGLVSNLCHLDRLAHPLARGRASAGDGIIGDLAERHDSDLERHFSFLPLWSGGQLRRPPR